MHLDGLPRTQQFSFGVQQQLGNNQIVELNYVGNVGQKLLSRYLYAYPDATTNPNFASGNIYDITRNDGVAGSHASYNSMQLSYQRAMSHGLQVFANYTFSHALDTGSSDSSFGQSHVVNDVASEDASLQYANSDFDRRHIFNFSAVYNIPKLHSQSTVLRIMEQVLTNGWLVAPNYKLQTGNPFSITFDYDDRVTSITTTAYRMNRVPGQPLYVSNIYNRGGKSFNVNAFTVPASGLQTNPSLVTNGDTSRNIYRGPALNQVDFALSRDFRVHDNIDVKFTTEFFNLLNHPNFASPDGFYGYVYNDPNYGPSRCPGTSIGMSCEYNSPDPRIGQHTGTLTDGTFGELDTLANGVRSGSGAGSSFDISLNPRYASGGPRSAQFSLRLSF